MFCREFYNVIRYFNIFNFKIFTFLHFYISFLYFYHFTVYHLTLSLCFHVTILSLIILWYVRSFYLPFNHSANLLLTIFNNFIRKKIVSDFNLTRDSEKLIQSNRSICLMLHDIDMLPVSNLS